jgi:hypothetical protein
MNGFYDSLWVPGRSQVIMRGRRVSPVEATVLMGFSFLVFSSTVAEHLFMSSTIVLSLYYITNHSPIEQG